MIRRTLLTAAALSGLCATANAAPETHDGFFLQFNIGPSAQDWTITNPPFLPDVIDELNIAGSGLQMDVNIGGAVAENIIVFAQFSVNTAVAPEVTLQGGNISASETFGDDVSAATVGIGGGVQYYVMPAGIYLAGSLLSVQLQLARDANGDGNSEERGGSEKGVGLQLRLGKEWWVSDEWGLGIAGSYLRASIPELGGDEAWTVNNFAVTFTATFN